MTQMIFMFRAHSGKIEGDGCVELSQEELKFLGKHSSQHCGLSAI